MDCNNIKNVKLNLAISQDAACVILDRLVRAAVDIPSAHDSNALIAYIDEQALLDNYPDGALGVVIADHRSKLQAAYDCCTVALEIYEAIEVSREQASNEKPALENKAPEGSTRVVFKIYGASPYSPDAEASIIWNMNKGGLVRCATSKGTNKFYTRQSLLDTIVETLTPAHSLQEYAESNTYPTEEKERVKELTRKLLADLGDKASEDYSGELMWESVNL